MQMDLTTDELLTCLAMSTRTVDLDPDLTTQLQSLHKKIATIEVAIDKQVDEDWKSTRINELILALQNYKQQYRTCFNQLKEIANNL